MIDYKEALAIANQYISDKMPGWKTCCPRVTDDDWLFLLYREGPRCSHDGGCPCLYIDKKTGNVEKNSFIGIGDFYTRSIRSVEYTVA